MAASHIALNRLGLGARIDEAEGLGDPRGWLLAQLAGAPPALTGQIPPAASIPSTYRYFIDAVASQDPARQRSAERALNALKLNETSAVLTTRLGSDRPFAERWVAFWSNHLCVSSAAGVRVATLAGPYEREAIRPRVFGRFEDLLLASARHPAMLLYLNNALSAGPGSIAVRRRGRRAEGAPGGLNENYARELLELHTVGVDGGYDQQDVEQLARILTGWSVEGMSGPPARGNDPVHFRFLDAIHEPGSKTVLGIRYAEEGEDEGERVIRDLARREETARFISTKIIRHFVDDDPPIAAVEQLADRWMATGGDLRSVATALVQLDEVWDERHRKFRTPQDWLVAMLRSVGRRNVTRMLILVLRQLRHDLWAPPAPTGYGDLAREWADPDSLMNRAELSRSVTNWLTQDRARRRIDPVALADAVDVPDGDPLLELLADRTIPASERLALGFAGPAFQWR